MTSAPSSANRTACDRPCPRAAPVINATLPSNCAATTASYQVADKWQTVRRGARPQHGFLPLCQNVAMASTEVERHTGVDVEDVPSAEWGWSGEAPRLWRWVGIFIAGFLLAMMRGNHVGWVENWYLILFAV